MLLKDLWNRFKPIAHQKLQQAENYLQPQNVIQRNVNVAQNIARPVQQFAQRQIQRPMVQANLHPITSLKTAYNSPQNDVLSNMANRQYNVPQSMKVNFPAGQNIVNKVDTYLSNKPVVKTIAGLVGYEDPQTRLKTGQSLLANKQGIASPEQRKLAENAKTNVALNAGFFSGGLENTTNKLVSSLVKSNTIQDVVKTLGKDAVNYSKNELENLAKTKNASEILNVVKSKVTPPLSNEGKGIKDFYVSIDRGNGAKFEKAVNPKKVDIAQGVDTFVHRDPITNRWVVSEGKTGLRVSNTFKSTREAITDATTRLTERKGDIQNLIQSALKDGGLSPTYQAKGIKPPLSNEGKIKQAVDEITPKIKAIEDKYLAPAFEGDREKQIQLELGKIAKKYGIDKNTLDYNTRYLPETMIPKGVSAPPIKPPLTPKNATEGVVVPSRVENAQVAVKPLVGQGGNGVVGPVVNPPETLNDTDLIGQLNKALRQAKPVRGIQEELYTKARGQKLAKLISAREQMAGEKGFYSELGALKGELPKAEYEPIRQQFNQQNVDRLFNMVKENKGLGEWDKINAQVGLSKLLGEKGMGVPTKGEIGKLYKVFGKDFTENLLNMRPFMDKLKDAGMQLYNLPRSMMAGVGDLSATLMQNLMFAYRHPATTAKNLVNEVKYFANDNFYKQSMAEIYQRPNAQRFDKAGISFTDVGPIANTREEQFMASWAEKIPGLGRVIKATGRAYTGFLNRMRADVADQLINTKKLLGENADDPRFLKSMGEFVNAATGRGNLGQLERVAPILGQGLFSARKLAAVVNMLDPRFYLKADPLIRKEALKSWLAFLGGAGTITGLAGLAGAETPTDMTSSDFGKIKIGNTRYNMFGTYQQLAVLFGRMFKGYATSSTTGKKMTLGEGYKPLTRLELVSRFFTMKEHPTLSLFSGALEGQNQIGDKFDWSTETLRRFIPMVASDAYDLYKEHGDKGLLGIVPTILGIPSQTYGAQVPNIESTPSGKQTIKFKNVPDIAENIVNKIRGKEISNIPKDMWGRIIAEKKIQTQKEIQKTEITDAINKGKDLSKIGVKENQVIDFGDGTAGVIIKGELKPFDSPQEAELAIEKDTFDKSGKKYQQIGDTFYYRDKSNKVQDKPMSDIQDKQSDLTYTLNLEQAKRADDLKGWFKLQDDYIAKLTTEYNGLDKNNPLDAMRMTEIENKVGDIATEYTKYQSYGGFKKGKAAPKAKISLGHISKPAKFSMKVKKPAKVKPFKIKKPKSLVNLR